MGPEAGAFEGKLFFGVCEERYRRDIRKAYSTQLDAGDIVDLHHEEFYMLGLTPKNAKSRPLKGEPHRVLHFSRVVAAMSWATAWRTLRGALDAFNPYSGYNNTYTTTLEPIEVRDAEFGHKPGSREGYRARPGMRLSGYRLADLSPVLRHAIQQKLPAGEKVVEHWVSPLDFEIDLTHLRANLKNPKVSPDAAAGDICLIAEPFFFASEPEVEANGPFLLDDALVATWAGLGDELAGNADAPPPTPQRPRCGKIGYGLLADGKHLLPLLHERVMQRPRNLLTLFEDKRRAVDEAQEAQEQWMHSLLGCEASGGDYGGDYGDDQEAMQQAITASLVSPKRKRKRTASAGEDEDLKRAIALSLQQQEKRGKRKKNREVASSSSSSLSAAAAEIITIDDDGDHDDDDEA